MHPSDRVELDKWLEQARELDVDALEREHAADQQRARAGQIRSLAMMIRSAPADRMLQAERRRQRRRLVYSVAAAAAVLLVGSFAGMQLLGDAGGEVALSSESGASLRQVVGKVIATHPNGEVEVVSTTTHVKPGDEISTTAQAFASLEAGKARLDLSSATTIQLTDLAQESQAFHLQAGRVDVSVPKVPGLERRIEVTTADAIVIVHGTVFSVEVEQRDAGAVTKVGVTRGLVEVRKNGQSVMLRAGQRWDSSLAPVRSASGEVDSLERDAQSVDTDLVEPSAEARAARSNQSATSSLARQNRLFSSGLEARDRGDDRVALARFRQLLDKYPDSPLRATVQAEVSAAKKRLQQAEE